MPWASIIMSTYNGERFLKNAIISVLQQEFSDIELLIVDDCSTDSTRYIIEEFANSDHRIKVFSTPSNSGGPSLPKNIGISAATGEIISFLDQDDLDHPRKISFSKQVFSRFPETEVLFFDVYGISESDIISELTTHEKTDFLGRASKYLEKIDKDIYQCKNYIGCMAGLAVGLSTQGIVIRRNCFDQLDFAFPVDMKVCDDIHLWFRLAEKFNMKYIHQPMAYYRHNSGSVTADTTKMMEEALSFHEKNYSNIGKFLTDSEKERYADQIGNLCFRLGYAHRRNSKLSRSYFLRSISYKRNFQIYKAVFKTYIPFYGTLSR